MRHGAELWLPTPRAVARPRLRLLCLAYAGGGATVFHPWSALFPADIEVRAAQLPGRQDRLREPPLESVEQVVAGLAEALASLPGAPLALYGHSFGAVVAFELAHRVATEHLVVAARKAPSATFASRVADLPTPRLLDWLGERYGSPAAQLRDPALLELIMPPLRADLRANEAYLWRERPPLAAPLTVLGGAHDASVSAADRAAWKAHTSGPFAEHVVSAGHLFVDTHRPWVVERVRAAIGA